MPHVRRCPNAVINRVLWASSLLLLVSLGCRPEDVPDLTQVRTVGGTQLQSLVDPSGSTVILVFDPAEVFSCFSGLRGWMTRDAQEAFHRTVLILTREPSDAERRLMAFAGLVPHGVLESSRDLPTPLQALFIHGTHIQTDIRINDRDAFEAIVALEQIGESELLAAGGKPQPGGG
jgi:hypothetical protein